VESIHRRHTSISTPVVDKRAIALGDEEETFDVISGFAREMVFQGANGSCRGKVADPECVSGLSRLPRRSSRIRGSEFGSGITP
jgi:hypothetical protein